MWKYVGYLVALAFVASCATDDGVTPQLCNAGVEGPGCAPSSDAGQGTDVALGTDAEGTDVDADTPMGTDADADTEDVAVGTDVDTADMAPDTVTTDVDSGSTDTGTVDPPPVEIPCDATNGVRLELTKVKDIWYDKLLNIDCKFFKAESGEVRCFPAQLEYQGAFGKGGDMGEVNRYYDKDCNTKIYDVLDDGKSKFWVMNSPKITYIRSMKDLPPVYLGKNESGFVYLTKAAYAAQLYKDKNGVMVTQCVAMGTHTPGMAANTTFMMDDGIAHLDKCPSMKNLNVFATK